MGTTLHALIEAHYAADVYHLDHWHTVINEVCFNKNYELMRLLRESGLPGWPDDKSYHAEGLDAVGTIDRGYWISGTSFLSLASPSPEIVRGVIAFLRAFNRPTRLLCWEM